MGEAPGSRPWEEARSRVTECVLKTTSAMGVGNAWSRELEKGWKKRNYQLGNKENPETGIGTLPTNRNMDIK